MNVRGEKVRIFFITSESLGCKNYLEYYSYKSLVNLYENNGLEIYKVIENDIQGGSYQIYARHYNKGSIDYKEDITTLFKFIGNS